MSAISPASLRAFTLLKQTGTAGDDEMRAAAGGNFLDALAGNDTLYGGGGPDTLSGGAGNDLINAWPEPLGPPSASPATVFGGDGNDTISASNGNDEIYGDAGDDNITDFGGTNLINGNAGDDNIVAGLNNDTIYGDDGSDHITDSGGENLIDGGAGNDTIDGGSASFHATLEGGEGNDYLQIDAGANRLSGGNGNDTIFAGLGDDSLYGGAGDDSLNGGQGHNYFDPGLGSDSMSGGTDNDHYHIRSLTQAITDTGGDDTVTVHVDFVKRPTGIEHWQLADGVRSLPYWVDALIPPGIQADLKNIGSGRTMYYSFPTVAPEYFDAADNAGFMPFNEAQKAQAIAALDYITSIVNLRFEEVANPDGLNIIAFANNLQNGSSGYAFFPGDQAYASDVHLDYSEESPTNLNPVDGTYGALTLIHEIGHALGLRHPFPIPDANGNTDDPPFLSGSEDHSAWTIMTYNNYVEDFHLQFKAFDIAALQYYYGPSQADQKDTVFELFADRSNLIWDGGGTDTIDGSRLNQSLQLHLQTGYWDYIGQQAAMISAAGQISINLGSQIENAKGGNGNDFIAGNALNNVIWGNDGDDVIQGLSGNDTIDGGSGSDIFVLPGNFSDYTIRKIDLRKVELSDKAGNIAHASNMEIARFADQDVRILGYVTKPVAETAGRTLYQSKPQIQLQGQGDADNVIEVFHNQINLGQATVDAQGNWRFQSAPLSDGSYALNIQATDAQGFQSLPVAAGEIKIDSQRPSAPSLVLPDKAGGVFGASPQFQGQTEAHAQVQLLLGGRVVANGRADASGYWQLQPSQSLPAGPYEAQATASDAAGNVSPVSNLLRFQVVQGTILQGSSQADYFDSGPGFDTVQGGAGIDTIRYQALAKHFSIQAPNADNPALQITDSSGKYGQDQLLNVERIAFVDQSIAFDVNGGDAIAGQLARLYHVAFHRKPDAAGFGFWLKQLDRGANLSDIASAFAASGEFTQHFPNVEANQVLDYLYNEVLQRAPDSAGQTYWQAWLASDHPQHTVAELLLGFSESAEHQALLANQLQQGVVFIPML